ncbi:MAG: SUMF1/EgtB/PvdO family nonheme iron enzyme [Paludibacteraceae bacterium]|nr:SUMF1/EgtB/PvdO family nonheme iron enzyme [Paludibacteraceae bacterium]
MNRFALFVFYILAACSLYARTEKQLPERKTVGVNGVTFSLIKVQGGIFRMGGTAEQRSDPYSTDKPVHQVVVDSYWMSETEVTRRLWKAVMGSAPKEGGNDWLADDLPQEWISWDDCQRFISRLDSLTGLQLRMPTEAEWEYAARGGQQSRHTKYAGSQDPEAAGWIYSNSGSRTHKAGGKLPNELGLYDMTGNVWEWCSDYFGLYKDSLQLNPTGPDKGTLRVVRGGSWDNVSANVNLSARQGREPEYTFYDCGLRLVLPAERVELPPSELAEEQRLRVKGQTIRFRLLTGEGLQPAYIAETEVTQSLWKAVMHDNPSARRSGKNPVEEVSWNDCQRFIAAMNRLTGRQFRLPTAAEWKYAAEGGQHSIRLERLDGKRDSLTIAANRPRYVSPRKKKAIRGTNAFLEMIPFGLKINEGEDAVLYDYKTEQPDTAAYVYAGSDDADKVAWHYGNSKGKPHPVGKKAKNELGLYDMSGNVAEWTQNLSVCGGSWAEHADHCRSKDSKQMGASAHSPYTGLRLVMEP